MDSPISLLNPRGRFPSHRTIVVLGLYRGGTSMIAGALRSLGVFFGERFDPGHNHEDLEFQGADAARIRDLVALRNQAHDVWGWKDPGSLFSFRDWRESLRNPYFVVVFRDVLAAAQTEIRTETFDDLFAALRMKHEHTTALIDAVDTATNAGDPMLLVSYERALFDRARFVRELAAGLGLRATAQDVRRIAAWINPLKGYNDVPDVAAADAAVAV